MAYLHEQYKVQQQHVMKLLELLDIGNCVNVIRDDCERTESIIFDDSLDDLGEYNIGGSRRGDASPGDDLSPDCALDDEDDESHYDDDDDLGEIEEEEEDQITKEDQMTMEDVLGEIVANVELIHNNSAKGYSHSVGVGGGDGGVTAGASAGDSSFVNVTISMRDLHTIPTPKTPLVTPRSNIGFESNGKRKNSERNESILETVL